MKVSKILEQVSLTRGTNAKSEILKLNADNAILKMTLKMGLDRFIPFNVVKIPKVKSRLDHPLNESDGWNEFFTVLNECASREITGNAAVDRVFTCFSSVSSEDEFWMRKILQKNLSIGASTKTVNKIFPGLIPTFDVSLAGKFEEKRIEGMSEVAIEPKLDGIRCFSIVENGKALLYARSGKLILNFNSTIGSELASLPEGCYDGEIMGKDFIALMRQAYRKDNVITDGTHLSLFDYIPMKEWKTREPSMSCRERYSILNDILMSRDLKYLKCIPRHIVPAEYSVIKDLHDVFVANGHEGAMIKDLEAPYKFGRGYEVMKLKAFHDVDLVIERLEAGTGRNKGRLGAIVVKHGDVEVKVGSGFTDELRSMIWDDPTNFIGRMVEVRYQEVTSDGSLRFPTFVCFRNDRGN